MLVQWKGWPSKYNSWIEKQITAKWRVKNKRRKKKTKRRVPFQTLKPNDEPITNQVQGESLPSEKTWNEMIQRLEDKYDPANKKNRHKKKKPKKKKTKKSKVVKEDCP